MGHRLTQTVLVISVFICVVASVESQWHYPNQYLTPGQIAKQQQQQQRQPTKRVLPLEARQEEATLKPTPPPSTEPPPFPSSLPVSSTSPPRCGETFNCSSSGIFHKPFEPVYANERCVWTVVVPGASGYQVDVFYLGWDPVHGETGSQVIISGFKRGSPPSEISPNGKGLVTINDASLLVITFVSGPNPKNSTGFILQYTALTNGSVPNIASKSQHELIRPETIYLRHPSTSSKYYENNELSSFVFQPHNNVHVEGKKNNIVYMRIGLDGPNCGDYLDVYGLNVTESEFDHGHVAKWDFRGRICGYLDTQLISSDDMIMMIFATDQGGTDYGFHLTYTTC